MMTSLPDGYRALVIGATGTIGAAFTAALSADPRCAAVTALSRASDPPLDLLDQASIATAADHVKQSPFHLIIVATGVLHADAFMPEKRLADLSVAQMEANFRINTLGPALLLRHFSPLLARDRGVFACLSAKVGSIGDNRAGGWYSYRASKAALNMMIKTAAIELKRTQPNTVLVALHPGTVVSRLSQPFQGAASARPAADAARDMLAVLDSLVPTDSGSFVSWNGERLPW